MLNKGYYGSLEIQEKQGCRVSRWVSGRTLGVNSYTGLESMRPGLSIKISIRSGSSGSSCAHASRELGFAWVQNGTE